MLQKLPGTIALSNPEAELDSSRPQGRFPISSWELSTDAICAVGDPSRVWEICASPPPPLE
eukprot:scaffold313928_cov31-Tisochrysis_lutea.AAC.1